MVLVLCLCVRKLGVQSPLPGFVCFLGFYWHVEKIDGMRQADTRKGQRVNQKALGCELGSGRACTCVCVSQGLKAHVWSMAEARGCSCRDSLRGQLPTAGIRQDTPRMGKAPASRHD